MFCTFKTNIVHLLNAYLLHQNKGGKTWDTVSHKDVKETL